MREPNVIGDWQECEGEQSGLRVRVHGLQRAEPPRGRDDATDGMVYFRFRVTVENRKDEPVEIHMEDGQLDIRMGPDGESAFLDWRNSQFIEGFDVYPLRRATAVLYAAGAEDLLTRLDVQVQLRADEEWTDRYLWSGDMTMPEGLLETGTRPEAVKESLACQVSNFLRREAEQGPA